MAETSDKVYYNQDNPSPEDSTVTKTGARGEGRNGLSTNPEAYLSGPTFNAVCRAAGVTHADKASALAELFPSLRYGVPGVRPWDALALFEWAKGPAPGSGARQAALFVLHVWNWTDPKVWTWTRTRTYRGKRERETFGFNLFRAVNIWDRAHMAAFQAWARDPFGL